MRPRIRTIKPEAFLAADLWDLGQATGLPVFQAFTGLLCWVDREGRFEWKPRELKMGILPYWEGDFAHVLAALAEGRFIIPYEHDGQPYAYVRTFARHQVVNNKESASTLPVPPGQVKGQLSIVRREDRRDVAIEEARRGAMDGVGESDREAMERIVRDAFTAKKDLP